MAVLGGELYPKLHLDLKFLIEHCQWAICHSQFSIVNVNGELSMISSKTILRD